MEKRFFVVGFTHSWGLCFSFFMDVDCVIFSCVSGSMVHVFRCWVFQSFFVFLFYRTVMFFGPRFGPFNFSGPIARLSSCFLAQPYLHFSVFIALFLFFIFILFLMASIFWRVGP